MHTDAGYHLAHVAAARRSSPMIHPYAPVSGPRTTCTSSSSTRDWIAATCSLAAANEPYTRALRATSRLFDAKSRHTVRSTDADALTGGAYATGTAAGSS